MWLDMLNVQSLPFHSIQLSMGRGPLSCKWHLRVYSESSGLALSRRQCDVVKSPIFNDRGESTKNRTWVSLVTVRFTISKKLGHAIFFKPIFGHKFFQRNRTTLNYHLFTSNEPSSSVSKSFCQHESVSRWEANINFKVFHINTSCTPLLSPLGGRGDLPT